MLVYQRVTVYIYMYIYICIIYIYTHCDVVVLVIQKHMYEKRITRVPFLGHSTTTYPRRRKAETCFS